MARAGLVVGGVILAAVLLGCSGEDQHVVTIDMEDNFYSRDVTRLQPGEAIRVRNRGLVPHNAIDVDGRWSTGRAMGGDEGDVLDPGDETTITFDEPGVYDFYCSLHAPDDASAGMSATLVVGDVDHQAAGEDAPDQPITSWSGETRRVPGDHPTIQNAVDAADPGDLVLIDPAPETPAHRAADGRYAYKEQVDIATPYLTVRGTDRNAVIIDGEHERPLGINTVAADGVAVENLTVRNTTGNGIYWTAVTGYRGSYLTAYNNGIYGIYAFDSTDGLFEHSYASGSKDAGFYIGQCDPCDAVVTDVVAENNGMGYSGTNASEVYLIESVWRHNVSGIVPNTLDSQRGPPFGRVTIAGNLIHDNDSHDAPALALQWSAFGNGVLLTGGLDSLVTANRIVNHERAGVTAGPNLSRNFWMSGGHVVRGNVIEGSGYADLVLAGPALTGTCFSGNDTRRTVPAALGTIAGCGPGAVAGAHADDADPDRGRYRLPSRYDLAPTLAFVGLVAEAEFGLQPVNDHRDTPVPPEQPQLPGGADAPVEPAVEVFERFDLDVAAISVPASPDDLVVEPTLVAIVGDVPIGIGGFSTLFGVLGWLGPFALFAAWVALALVDLARREELGRWTRVAWTIGVLVIPFVGAPAYLLAGGATFPRWLRWTVVVIGASASVLLLGAAALAGGLL
ncbi:MAG: right-handed parallel beta-helix repeat-containing protein [Nitriliruptoraceae bacterium]